MKLTYILLLLSFLQLSAASHSQTISLNGRGLSMKEVFVAIKQQTGDVVVGNAAYIQKCKPMDIHVNQMPIREFLKLISANQSFTFKIEEKTIVLVSNFAAYQKPNPGTIVHEEEYTQQLVLQGDVKNEQGNPIPGISVMALGAKAGTSTNEEGKFTLNLPFDASGIQLSGIGYKSLSIKLKNTAAGISAHTEDPLMKNNLLIKTGTSPYFQITLQEDIGTLEETVIVGYGTSKRKDLTGAISSLSSSSFNLGKIANPLQQIQGKVPGLVVTMPGGDPNESPVIRLRGQASLTGGQTPLFIVDGVALDDAALIADIPPGDIASYDVLKDASASAIYGSRAANGVIIINTKKGEAGRTSMEYNGNLGVDRLQNKYNMLNSSEYLSRLDANSSSFDKGGNTDWMDAITRPTLNQSHNLALSGGSEHFKYRASGTYIKNPGVILNTGKDEVGVRFNAEQKAFDDRLNIQLGAVNTITNRKYADYSIFEYVINTPPTYPVYNSDGSYFGYFDYDMQNPIAQQMLQTNKSREKFSQLYGTANFKVNEGLTVGATGSISDFSYDYKFFQPELPGVGNVNNGVDSTRSRYSKKADIHVNYTKTWDKHHFDLTAVHEYNNFAYDYAKSSGEQFLLDDNGPYGLGNGNAAKNNISTYKEEYSLASFLGRIAYNFDSKYYLTTSIRRDGSSKFGSGNRWGTFPSVSVAWRLDQQNSFLKNTDWIDELKLRAGFGITGNQESIDPYRTLLLLGASGRYYDPANSSNPYPQAYSPTQNANPDLRWEERRGKNIGLDFALFKSRFDGSVNYFNDETKHLLFNYNVPVPPYYVTTILANVGTLSNKGLEIQLHGEPIRKTNFNWDLSGQISFLKTQITSLSGTFDNNALSTDDIPTGRAQGRGLSVTNYISYLKVGYAPYVFYLPHYTGIDESGAQLFETPDGPDKDYTKATYHYIDPSAKFTYGLNNTFTYKRITLNFFLRGVYGQKIFNNTRLMLDNIGRLPSSNVTVDALTNGIKDNNPVASDLWLQNASYLRLDNITLSYNFHDLIKQLQTFKVFFTANNVFVITPYKGLDPEIRIGDNNQSYIDYTYNSSGYYPKTRTFMLGVSLGL